jgi:YidC/Oxa1 family membrane protein insertase
MSNSPGSLPPEPPSYQKRLPLALGLMMLVLLASQYFFKPVPTPKPAVTPKNDTAVAQQVTQAPPSALAAPIGETPAAAVGETIATQQELDTDLYHVVFSNKGGVAKSWVIKKYKDESGKPLQIINPSVAGSNVPEPFAIETEGQKLSFDPNTVLYRTNVINGGLTVEFDYSDGKSAVHKSFTFRRDSYLADVKSSVTENNIPVPHLLLWRGGFGDPKIRNAYSIEHTVYYDAAASKLKTNTAKDAKNGPVTNTGNFTFGGLEDTFFAAVALPAKDAQLQVRTYSDSLKPVGEEKEVPYPGAGISTGAQNDFTLFIGPKDVEMLTKVNPKLGQLVDWGFFGVIAKPLFLWLNWVNDHLTNNYGWAIILVTLIINIALFPFRLSSLKSARKMQKLQPEIKRINEKYKNLSISDPRKAEQNQAVMDLYKREGVNPVGGCLPLLVQLPFFYAFYRVLNIAIELRHAPWLWVTDLSSPESIAIHILPLILVATQFFSQKLTPTAGVDPTQQRMMMLMPLMFGFMFYYASAGLVLYWLTGNLVGIVQQLIINRFMPPAASAPPAPAVPIPSAPPKSPVKRANRK